MDYSSIQEHEPSPWSTSPQHSRTPSGQQEPPSPSPALPPPTVHEQPDDEDGTRPSQDTTLVEDGQDTEPSTPLPAQRHLSPEDYQASQFQQPPHSPQVEQTQIPQKAPRSAQRYHGQRPRSRQDVPVYKLQPRITGLERPTRKELNIRFDVHVCCLGSTASASAYT